MSSASSSDSSSPLPVKRKRVTEEHDDVARDAETADIAEDTVALSHAEKRRQKKKDQKAEDQPSKKRKVTDGSVAGVSTKDSKPTGKPKRQNSVWVGNLWFKTTPDALRNFFDGVGEITRIHMPTKKGTKGDNMGFAYVDFATPDGKVTAITQSERELHGRNLLVKDGMYTHDFAGRPTSKPTEGTQENDKGPSAGKSVSGLTKTQQKILRVQKQPPAQTLFLGNLGFDTTVDSIRELFEAHRHPHKAGKGHVWLRKIRMGTFEDSGACKGFAFLDFTSTEHATAALINPRNHRLNGRDLVVEYASADAVRRGGGPRLQQNTVTDNTDTESRPQSHSRPRRRDEDEKEHRTQRDDAESTPQRNQKEAPRHMKADRSRGRPKPGAALAQAPRESAAIIPSQGHKIVF
ncbi:uncharacterized protein EDB91DRAFT_1215906 [Suillus paluster]|uniref:uncharacterized protein n=1 Tax=Suillus paluster TaxID=48578 RepID=UPI001B8711B9|nr:uncharacterized protein EDB91DRAFT_1215906 [Suillus paluster]KAG1752417.1 hypothetical protein EDB91DRAFT_1215906 [Suillus paluster]